MRVSGRSEGRSPSDEIRPIRATDLDVLGYTARMITAAHVLLYSKNADADRTFFRDVLKLRHVDAGHGWLIFRLPPSEVAMHPGDDVPAAPGDASMIRSEMYLMCDDVKATIAELTEKSVRCGAIVEERWGTSDLSATAERRRGRLVSAVASHRVRSGVNTTARQGAKPSCSSKTRSCYAVLPAVAWPDTATPFSKRVAPRKR